MKIVCFRCGRIVSAHWIEGAAYCIGRHLSLKGRRNRVRATRASVCGEFLMSRSNVILQRALKWSPARSVTRTPDDPASGRLARRQTIFVDARDSC